MNCDRSSEPEMPPSVFEPEWLKSCRRAVEADEHWVELRNNAAVLVRGDLTEDERETLAEYIDWRRSQRGGGDGRRD